MQLANTARIKSGGDATLLRQMAIEVVQEHLRGLKKADLQEIIRRLVNATSGPPQGASLFRNDMPGCSWLHQLGVWLMAMVWEELRDEFVAGTVQPLTPTRVHRRRSP
jgi:hypothetical protein